MILSSSKSGRWLTILLLWAGVLIGSAGLSSAQTIQVSVAQDIVAPGFPVPVTVTGPPGQFFAVAGSATGAGFTYGGVALPVGPDVVVLHVGVLDGTGQAVVPVTAPFLGSQLDRYYVVAAWANNSSFLPPTPSSHLVLRNRDLLSSVVGPQGPVGPVGPTGPQGPLGLTGPTGPQGPQRCRESPRSSRGDRPSRTGRSRGAARAPGRGGSAWPSRGDGTRRPNRFDRDSGTSGHPGDRWSTRASRSQWL